jgi:putative nucleotidyltransferase with HDIG domain
VISSLRLALVVLGMGQIRSLVIGVSVLKIFGGKADKRMNLEAFWEHCAGTGVLCRMLARKCGLNFGGEEYVAGLTHDIGKLTLYQYMHDEFSNALAEAIEKNEALETAERRVIGADHAFVGGWLARKWGLPQSLVEAIRNHHAPVDPVGPGISTIVNLADGIARVRGIGDSMNPVAPDIASLKGWRALSGRMRNAQPQRQGGEPNVDPESFLKQLSPEIASARNFAQVP